MDDALTREETSSLKDALFQVMGQYANQCGPRMGWTPSTAELIVKLQPIVKSFAQVTLICHSWETLKELTASILHDLTTALVFGE